MLVPLEEYPVINYGGMWLPYFERDEETGKILWQTIAWRPWLRDWLPGHVVRWLDYRQLCRAIARRSQLGMWTTIPKGYEAKIIHKPVGSYADPLDQQETIGVKLTAIQEQGR